MIAAVRVRGEINLRQDMRRTLEMLHLHRKNYCAVLKETPATIGMVEKVKDFVTFGNIDDETAKRIFEARGEQSKEGIRIGGKEYKPFLRLAPPKKGYGRKGIKQPFSRGGALGNRGDKISELIMRMI